MGDGEKAHLRLQFNPRIRLEFHGATITSDAGLLAFRELDDALDLTPIASDYLHLEGPTSYGMYGEVLGLGVRFD